MATPMPILDCLCVASSTQPLETDPKPLVGRKFCVAVLNSENVNVVRFEFPICPPLMLFFDSFASLWAEKR